MALDTSGFVPKGNLNTDSANRLDKLLERSLAAKKYFLEKISCINDILLEIIDLEFDNREDSKLHNELVVEIAVEKELKYRLLNFLKDKQFSVTDFLAYKNNLIAQGTDIESQCIAPWHVIHLHVLVIYGKVNGLELKSVHAGCEAENGGYAALKLKIRLELLLIYRIFLFLQTLAPEAEIPTFESAFETV